MATDLKSTLPRPAAAPEDARPRAGIMAGIALAVALVLWASAFAGIRVGLRAYSPYHLALLRFLAASLTLALYALVRPFRLPALRDLPLIAVAAVAGFPVYHVALNYAEVQVSAGVAGLLISTSPVMAAILAGVMLGERMGTRGWIGTAVSFAGAALIAMAGERDIRFPERAIWVIVAALGGAIYTIAQKRGLKTYSALEFTAYAMWTGTAALLVFLPGFAAAVRAAPPSVTLVGVYLGVFPAAVSYLLWAQTLDRMTVSRAVSFLYLVPAIAIVIAWVWIGERPTLAALLGGTLVIGGVALVNARSRR